MSSEKVPDTESAVDHNESLLPLISNEAPAPMSMTVFFLNQSEWKSQSNIKIK